MATLLGTLGQPAMADTAAALAATVDAAIQQHGTMVHPVAGRVYAYEVDGFGNAVFMDDANVPSLLSLPYLGYVDAKVPGSGGGAALRAPTHLPAAGPAVP